MFSETLRSLPMKATKMATHHVPDLNNPMEIEMDAETLTIPQLISLLKPSFHNSALQKIESVLTQRENALAGTLALKELDRMELLKRCSELEEQLQKKQREVESYETALRNLKEEVKSLYVELVAEKMESEELRARVSELEKEGGAINVSDREDDSVKSDSELKKDAVVEKDVDFLLTPTPKRKRASRVVTSDSEDDREDDTPIAKLKKAVPVEHKDGLEDDDSDDDDVPIGKLRDRRLMGRNGDKNDMAYSRRRLVKLGECGPTKDDEEREVSPSLSRSPSGVKSRNRSSVRQQLVFSAVVDAKEKRMDDVSSGDSEDDSLDGFIVDGSESVGQESESSSSDSSREDSPSDVDLDDVLSTLRRKRNTKKWEYESDMLASFAEDPELCMRAVCALYRQQTHEEQSLKGSIAVNKRGFNPYDAGRASTIAEFLLDGNINGPPKKSVEQFVKRYPDGLEYCRKIADRYSKQLFTIYQQGEDPFFLPSASSDLESDSLDSETESES